MSQSALAMLSPADAASSLDDGGYFQRHFGVPLARLLAPLEGSHPVGMPLRGTMTYRMIEQARLSDDATLPMGSWAVELKRANWPKVSALIVQTLDDVGKDMQLASWLFEAELHQRGFSAVAPCFVLLRGLCEHWWQELHPLPDGNDFEARCNIVRWLNEKLLTTVSLLPLVDNGEHMASWSHWELAHYHERLRAVHGELPEEAQNAATLDDLHGLLSTVDSDELRQCFDQLQRGREAMAAFESLLREQLRYEAPSLGKLDDLLAKAQTPLRSEIARRGERMEKPAAVPPEAFSEEIAADEGEEQGDYHEESAGDPGNSLAVLVNDRQRAYSVLEEIGDYLMQVEPHSPVPYLIKRAVAWGQLNAAELYQEVFQKSGGRIDVFELLGLESRES
ncbi:MAG TPA: type VI secretion system protein TssA [Dyella sp.]|uniref:type VI secretion system protein TssA n=1 Tax=Dyella sp. TaxID=1869338 RepID=UPI002F95CFAD